MVFMGFLPLFFPHLFFLFRKRQVFHRLWKKPASVFRKIPFFSRKSEKTTSFLPRAVVFHRKTLLLFHRDPTGFPKRKPRKTAAAAALPAVFHRFHRFYCYCYFIYNTYILRKGTAALRTAQRKDGIP